jgi:hypothetical protein
MNAYGVWKVLGPWFCTGQGVIQTPGCAPGIFVAWHHTEDEELAFWSCVMNKLITLQYGCNFLHSWSRSFGVGLLGDGTYFKSVRCRLAESWTEEQRPGTVNQDLIHPKQEPAPWKWCRQHNDGCSWASMSAGGNLMRTREDQAHSHHHHHPGLGQLSRPGSRRL